MNMGNIKFSLNENLIFCTKKMTYFKTKSFGFSFDDV